jgi:hypothetical protein
MALMSTRVVVLMLLGMLLVITPQVRGVTTCAFVDPFMPPDSQTEHSDLPSTDCGSKAHAVPSFAVSCPGCGIALLTEGLFLPEGSFLDLWDPVETLASASPPAPHWRPPT